MRTVRFLALGFLLLAAFVWGFATDRLKIFPMPLIRRAARMGGIGGWQSSAELHSRSPALAALASIPYLSGRFDPDSALRSVVDSVPGRVSAGLNFYSTLARARAFLIDNEGRVRWRWSVDRYFDGADLPSGVDLGYPHLYPNGDVLAYVGDRALIKLDRNSNLLWKHVGRVHHDAWVCPDGTIYTLTHGSRTIPEIDPRLPSLLDSITVLSPEGNTMREISLLEVLRKSPYAFLLPHSSGMALPKGTDSIDVLHANHIEVFDGALEKKSSLYRRGNILISMKNINSVAIMDGRTLQILWLWGPTNLTLQHHPTLLENGDILLFDNGTKESEVVEVNPATDEVVWRYAPENGFFSSIQGACQRLPAGDTLITVSQGGYALEVSPSGSIVWKFANPEVRTDGFREGIYRMTRYRENELAFLTDRPPSP
jgi:outer membrane protein assembly factor BamB